MREVSFEKSTVTVDLADELESLIQALNEAGVEYALCGGLAMAVHGVPRATVDIDLMVPPEETQKILDIAQRRGFILPADEMVFADGTIRIRRVSKIDPDTGEPIPLDLILVTPSIEPIWEQRQELEWLAGELWVLSRAGLIDLKKIRSSAQDRADIEMLENDADA